MAVHNTKPKKGGQQAEIILHTAVLQIVGFYCIVPYSVLYYIVALLHAILILIHIHMYSNCMYCWAPVFLQVEAVPKSSPGAARHALCIHIYVYYTHTHVGTYVPISVFIQTDIYGSREQRPKPPKSMLDMGRHKGGRKQQRGIP